MRLIPTLLLCSASIIGISTPAMAQDTAPEAGPDEAAENVIIVQTRRRDEAIPCALVARHERPQVDLVQFRHARVLSRPVRPAV